MADSDSSVSSSDSSDSSDSSSLCSSFIEDLENRNSEQTFKGFIEPFSFEPQGQNIEETDHVAAEENEVHTDDRLMNTEWCTCEFCQRMDRREECVCCKEVDRARNLMRQAVEDGEMQEEGQCITLHPGLKAVCLNVHVLKTAWYQYKQQYGSKCYEGPEHKKYRHVGYRQFVRWCWGFLGKEIRVPLPSCVVSCIRAHFPPPGLEENFEFQGFCFADE
ncbi:uncharacterized protein LOC110252894 [Exaiptasia diaphana]|uniref:P2X purinoreceptor 7 intracellular domain-containing protein n=1 Tax=Exaiptasia diaphana TaxID=2652724 RepID=A0A913Y758_EXADI|nr:uncharacterized protein LOC110252894 [Exaiptasia diaphana]